MKLGIFAKTFSGIAPQTVLAAAAEAGYDTVQYNMACSGIGALPEKIEPDIAEQVHQASRKTGVEIAAISATYNMVHPDQAKRDAGQRSFNMIASRAKAMGSNLLTVCSGSKNPDDQWAHHPDNHSETSWRDMLDEFGLLIRTAEQHDIFIGVEPELGNIVRSADQARLMLDTLKSDRIRIVLDPANLFETAAENERRAVIEHAVDTLADSIVMAHAKDRDATGAFVAAGKGVIDFPHFISRLRQAGFNGNLVTHGLNDAEAAGVARFLRDALK